MLNSPSGNDTLAFAAEHPGEYARELAEQEQSTYAMMQDLLGRFPTDSAEGLVAKGQALDAIGFALEKITPHVDNTGASDDDTFGSATLEQSMRLSGKAIRVLNR